LRILRRPRPAIGDGRGRGRLRRCPIRGLATKIFGSANDRLLKRLQPRVARINELEPRYEPLGDEDLRRAAGELRLRADKGEPLDDLLPEAFALVREAAKRTLHQRHYDVQLLGGIVLHQGKIAEMKTGEGKTLVATLPSFLNALSGKGVHVVTVNDYLARRDAEWMGQIHRLLGLETGCVVTGMTDAERRRAYHADVIYGQNNEFGFDYLRDNMKPSLELYVQGAHSFAIVDEVDSILIDEARTPLIISGPVEDSPERFRQVDRIIPRLRRDEHFTVDEKQRSALLTDEGVGEVERLLGIENLYAPHQMDTLHVVQSALRAHTLYKRDVDYVVKDGQVVIVDEHTGRLMEGRRWSDGLHQAVEAKEGVDVQNETQTYASITFQNYFRMYDKLAGMTGTADTEAREFAEIYGLDVVIIPTNKPMIRKDCDDVVYRSKREKWTAVTEDIAERHQHGQPILVGTIAIETSEMLAAKLKNRGIPHNVLNAKHHEREAEIIAQAGAFGAVTISTNMAGRGTDIVLGGNPDMMLKARGLDLDDPTNQAELERVRGRCAQERDKVLAAGGLYVLGTERHESRRIDNQLRGRSGRQGDPGESRFYLSLEDDLLRIFGGDRLQGLMTRLGMQEGEAIEARMLSGAIERAQKKVEMRNFDIRKHLLQYDDVMNKQRSSIYAWRKDVLSSDNLEPDYRDMAEGLLDDLLDAHVPLKGEPDLEALARDLHEQFGVRAALAPPPGDDPVDREALRAGLVDEVGRRLDGQIAMFSELAAQHPDLRTPSFQGVARAFLLESLDHHWKEHLLAMDHLKEGIGLRGYAQKDPKLEYQREGFEMFQEMGRRVRSRAVQQLFRVVFEAPTREDIERARARERAQQEAQARRLREQHASASPVVGGQRATEAAAVQPVVREGPKVGRNEPCPCGSGKKFKKCCGAAA
jgi:preprotein translocase subunit SecA